MTQQDTKNARIFRLKSPRPGKLKLARRLRKEPTKEEDWVWEQLRDKKMFGLKFRRQQPILGFIADFYCASLGLVLELDGLQHSEPERKSYDARRTEAFKRIGLFELRIPNQSLSLATLTEKLRHAISQRTPRSPTPTPAPARSPAPPLSRGRERGRG